MAGKKNSSKSNSVKFLQGLGPGIKTYQFEPISKSNPQKFIPLKETLFNGMIVETKNYYPGVKSKKTNPNNQYDSTLGTPRYDINLDAFKDFIKNLKAHIKYNQFLKKHIYQHPPFSLHKKQIITYNSKTVRVNEDSEISENALSANCTGYNETRLILKKYEIEDLHHFYENIPYINMRYISTRDNFGLWFQFINLIYIYYRIPFHNPFGRPAKNDVYTPEVLCAFNYLIDQSKKKNKKEKKRTQINFEEAFTKIEKMFPHLKGIIKLGQLKKLRKPSFYLNESDMHPRNAFLTVTLG